jgi:hypothetical protein
MNYKNMTDALLGAYINIIAQGAPSVHAALNNAAIPPDARARLQQLAERALEAAGSLEAFMSEWGVASFWATSADGVSVLIVNHSTAIAEFNEALTLSPHVQAFVDANTALQHPAEVN